MEACVILLVKPFRYPTGWAMHLVFRPKYNWGGKGFLMGENDRGEDYIMALVHRFGVLDSLLNKSSNISVSTLKSLV